MRLVPIPLPVCALATAALAQGSHDSGTPMDVQHSLGAKGYHRGPVDGEWGPEVEAVLKGFRVDFSDDVSEPRLDPDTLGPVGIAPPDGVPAILLQEGHAKPIAALAFSPAGDLLASADDGGAIRLWDAASGRLIRAWATDRAPVALAFSPNGRALTVEDGEDMAGRDAVGEARSARMETSPRARRMASLVAAPSSRVVTSSPRSRRRAATDRASFTAPGKGPTR